MPCWKSLAKTYKINYVNVSKKNISSQIDTILMTPGSFLCIVPIDPKQTYFPKISSRITKSGSMESNPLHEMSPDITFEEKEKFLKYI